MMKHGVAAAAAIALSACASHPAPPVPSAAAAPAARSSPAADSPAPPSSNELKRLVAGSREALQACYAAAVKENPALGGGTVAVAASVSPAGAVTVMSTNGPPELQVLDGCIKGVVSALPFPPSPEEYGVEFNYEFEGP